MKITVQKVIKGLRYLKHYGFKEFVIRLQEKMEAENVPYEPWYKCHRAKEDVLARQKKISAAWKDAPLISIVVPLYCTNERFLREMIESVLAQSYGKWELCLADGRPSEPEGSDGRKFAKGQTSSALEAPGREPESSDGYRTSLTRIVREYADADSRIVYKVLSENLGIAGNTNAAIALATGEWIAFLDHDDLLAPDALYEAALCRSRADWLVGINATRLFSVLYHRTLNVGRVVSPTLALIVQREAEIKAFTPVPFYTVDLTANGFEAASERFSEKASAEGLQKVCKGASATVTGVERKEKTEKAPALYDLTTLQRDANRLLGYTAQQTLEELHPKICAVSSTGNV